MRTTTSKKNDKLWYSGWGNDEASIMLLVSHPTYGDIRNGQLLAEDEEEYSAFNEISEALNIVGLSFEDMWVTSMVKYGIGSKDKPTSEHINECAPELDEEIAQIKPKLIIALGAEAFKRVMGSNIKQSDYLGEIIPCQYGHVMAQYSPAQVFRVDPKLRPEFIANFELAKRFINDDLNYQEIEEFIITDPKENAEFVKMCIDAELFSVGYDLEWVGEYSKEETLYSFQYSVIPHQAVVLPLVSEKGGPENLELLNTMKPLLEHPKVDRLGWNIRADDKRLISKGFNISGSTLGFDGMKAMAFFDSRWGKGLEYGIKKFTNYRPYYNAFNEALTKNKLPKSRMSELLFIDQALFYSYAAGDAVSHRTACLNMRERMNKEVPKNVIKYYNEVYLPMTDYLTDMERTGIPIDIDCLRKLTEQYKTCYDELYKSLMTQTKALGFDDEQFEAACKDKDEEEVVKEGKIFKTFNPKSAPSKSKLFFDVLKLEPAYYVMKGKAKPKTWYDKQKPTTQAKYKPSTNGKSISSIRFSLAEQLKNNPDDTALATKHNLVSTYLNLARVGVFAGKFFSTKGVDMRDSVDDFELLQDEGDEDEDPLKSSYWAALGNDGKTIHADFYECLDNFRSSSRPNVQNPASKVLSHIPAIFDSFKMEQPKNIRNIFYSGDKDWHFAEVDVAGADLAIAAFLSRDPLYIKDILQGGFHTTKMRDYFKDPNLSKKDASKYVTSKSITFRVAYTAGLRSAAIPIQAEIYAESGNLVDIKLIEYALDTWTNYSTYMDYRKQCQDEVEYKNSITNMRGMKFKFENTDNFSIKAGWMNQSLAFPIASELALFMYDVSVQLKAQLERDNNWMRWIKPVNLVHDANYWIIHKDMMKDGYFPDVCKRYFTEEVKIATGDRLGIEMVVADRWKGKEKIFEKETTWDFKEKVWKW